jgi:hypothetical protein
MPMLAEGVLALDQIVVFLIESTIMPFGNGQLKCSLCGTFFPTLAKQLHLSSAEHIANESILTFIQQKDKGIPLIYLYNRVKLVQYKRAREELMACILREYMTSFCYRRTLNLLKYHEYMDRIAQVELAVWKSMCIANPCKTPRNDYFSWSEWGRKGWKQQKEQFRKSNWITIIMSLILPFLEKVDYPVG